MCMAAMGRVLWSVGTPRQDALLGTPLAWVVSCVLAQVCVATGHGFIAAGTPPLLFSVSGLQPTGPPQVYLCPVMGHRLRLP